jgi:hypothetical protein
MTMTGYPKSADVVVSRSRCSARSTDLTVASTEDDGHSGWQHTRRSRTGPIVDIQRRRSGVGFE